jgi:hypothetical protein
VIAQEKLPDWERLWDDFTQEETREEALQGNQAKGDEDEENVVLHAKKGSGDGKDISKVKLFACHKIGHYASQCPNKKQVQVASTTSIEIDDFAEKFEKEFSLVSFLLSNSFKGYEDIGAWIVSPYDRDEVNVS